MKRRLLSAGLGLTLVFGLAAVVGLGGSVPRAGAATTRPNIVLILMDDFSVELLRTMPQARKLQARSASFDNAFVVDSSCCPSRSSLLTGLPPHLTGVLNNTIHDPQRPTGGWAAFRRYGNLKRSVNVSLDARGYTTGFIGKYLNGYEPVRRDGRLRPPPLPPGWDDFQAIFKGGYSGWGYRSSYVDAAGRLRLRNTPVPRASATAAEKDRSYSNHVMADKAVAFLRKHRDDRAPYFLEVSTYATHSSLRRAWPGEPRFPAAFRDRPHAGRPGGNCGAVACSSLGTDDLVGYEDDRRDNAPVRVVRGKVVAAPAWNTVPRTMGVTEALRDFRNRARMAQSIDRLIGRVRAEVGPDTYVVVTSDNGYHLRQHGLNGGKGTAYDTDTRVPLLVAGPGVVPGRRSQFVSNIDVAPTLERLAGIAPVGRAGRSFGGALREPRARGKRFVFFEHTNNFSAPGDPDPDVIPERDIEFVPSYVAVRSARGLLVRVDLDRSWTGVRYAWELYRYDRPWEDRNVFAEDWRKPWARELRERLLAFDGCERAACRAAAL